MRNALIALAVIALGVAFWWYFATGVTGQRRAADASHETSSSRAAHAVPHAAGSAATAPVDDAPGPGAIELRGTVTDQMGGPIGGARIAASQDAPVERARAAATAPDGTFRLAVEPGEWRIAASHADYVTAAQWIFVDDRAVPCDFALVPGGTLHGVVVSRATGAPVPDATVRALDVERLRDDLAERAVTDADGAFTLRGLRAGAVALHATGRGFASAAPVIVELALGEQRADVRVPVDRAYSIAGRVVREGAPTEGVADVGVTASSWALVPSATATTDASGAFELVGLLPATYGVGANRRGLLPAASVRAAIVDRDVAGVAITVAPSAVLRGRVDPPGPAFVSLWQKEAQFSYGAAAEADARGAFAIVASTRGKGTLSARAPDGADGSIEVASAERDQSDFVIHLEPGGSISGTVRDQHGAAFAGASVEANGGGTASGLDGTYRLRGLGAGTVRVRASAPTRESWRHSGPASPEVAVEVAVGAERTGVDLVVERPEGAIRGRVVDSAGAPAADASVTAKRFDAADPKCDASFCGFADEPAVLARADGAFVVPHLAAGTYTLTAVASRGTARAVVSGVAPGGSPTLVLAALGSLRVRVTADGAPVTTYDLECDGDARIERHVIAADGAAELARLVPREYRCTAATPTASREAWIEVGAGATQLDLALARYGSLVGRLVDAKTGEPIAGAAVGPLALDERLAVDSAERSLTDRDGRFRVDAVPARHGILEVSSAANAHLGFFEYGGRAGERVDLGTVKVDVYTPGR